MRAHSTLFAGISTLVLAIACIAAEQRTTITPANLRKPAPDFTLQDSGGASVHLASYKGKVVLLDFWATWCHGCKTEIPWYVEFVDRYQDRGLAAIGVSMDDDGWKSVEPFLNQHKINYPVVVGNEALGKKFSVEQMPVTLLIDQNGKIAESHAGVVDKDAFEADIRSLLAEAKRARNEPRACSRRGSLNLFSCQGTASGVPSRIPLYFVIPSGASSFAANDDAESRNLLCSGRGRFLTAKAVRNDKVS